MGCDIHPYFETQNKDGVWLQFETEVDQIRDQLYDPAKAEAGCELSEVERKQLQEKLWSHPLDIGRNYNLFAILANVRNGRGFAGVKTGDGYEPIDMPRGLPPDVSQTITKEDSCSFDAEDRNSTLDDWQIAASRWVAKDYSIMIDPGPPMVVSNPDHHSHSWYTLKELLDYDWTAKTTVRQGVVSQAVYAAWDRDKVGYPEHMSGFVTGPKVKNITEEEMQQRIADKEIDDGNYYCSVRFEMRYDRCCDNFVNDTLPELQRIADAEVDGDYTKLRFVFWFDN